MVPTLGFSLAVYGFLISIFLLRISFIAFFFAGPGSSGASLLATYAATIFALRLALLESRRASLLYFGAASPLVPAVCPSFSILLVLVYLDIVLYLKIQI
tara:strand:+ start:463 stop:762 length:300 start_codon:yes stop_codon:yes gene_type:complete